MFLLIFIYFLLFFVISAEFFDKCHPQDRISRPCIPTLKVCGYSNKLDQVRTYTSKCEACQNREIKYITRNPCLKHLLQRKSIPGYIEQCQAAKGKCLGPVCGTDEKFIEVKNFESDCVACESGEVRYFFYGKCRFFQREIVKI